MEAAPERKEFNQTKDFKSENCYAQPETDQLAVMYARYLQSLYLLLESKQQWKMNEKQMEEDLVRITEMIITLLDELLPAKRELQNLEYSKLLRDAVTEQSKVLANAEDWLKVTSLRKLLLDELDGRRHFLETKGISPLSEKQHNELIYTLKQLDPQNFNIFNEKHSTLCKDLDSLKDTMEEEMSLVKDCKELLLEIENLSINEQVIQVLLMGQKL